MEGCGGERLGVGWEPPLGKAAKRGQWDPHSFGEPPSNPSMHLGEASRDGWGPCPTCAAPYHLGEAPTGDWGIEAAQKPGSYHLGEACEGN
jgi:hypothetical protein